MEVEERLTLEAASAHSLIATEHVHRYQLAARLCRDLRVLDLACGSGYGSAILADAAEAVTGVDRDVATIEMAIATIGRDGGPEFRAADALATLREAAPSDWDAIVCFEGLEHFGDLESVLGELRRLVAEGVRVVVSVPNSRTFGEDNRFHVTEFGYDDALAAFRTVGEATVLYQFNAEGSLIRQETPSELEGEFALDEHGEPEYANHIIACFNLEDRLAETGDLTRMRLAAAPDYNRHMLALERANRDLWRENARLARNWLAKSEAAAASAVFKIDEAARERAERAEERIRELEAEVDRLRAFERLATTPRHLALEKARDRARTVPSLYEPLRRAWALIRRS